MRGYFIYQKKIEEIFGEVVNGGIYLCHERELQD